MAGGRLVSGEATQVTHAQLFNYSLGVAGVGLKGPNNPVAADDPIQDLTLCNASLVKSQLLGLDHVKSLELHLHPVQVGLQAG